MKTLNKTTGLIVLLVILNLFSLGALWFSHSGYMVEGKKGHGQRAGRFLKRELQLDDKQFEAFRALRDEHFEARRAIEKAIRKEKRALLQSINTANDTTEVNYPQNIGLLEEKKEKLFLEHLHKIKTICTPEQQEKLSKVFLKAMRPRRGPPR